MKQHIELTEYERNYIELTEYDSNGRIVIFVDSIQGLCRAHDDEHHKDFTKVMVSGYTFAVNEPIGEILKRIEGVLKEDNKPLCEYDQNCIKAGYEKALQKINKIRTEIEAISDDMHTYIYGMCKQDVLNIIDRNMKEDIE